LVTFSSSKPPSGLGRPQGGLGFKYPVVVDRLFPATALQTTPIQKGSFNLFFLVHEKKEMVWH